MKLEKNVVNPALEQQFTCFTVISSVSSRADTGITVDTILTRATITACMVNTLVDVYKRIITGDIGPVTLLE